MLEQRVVTFSKSLAAQLVFPMETSRVQIFSPLTIELSKNKESLHMAKEKKKKTCTPSNKYPDILFIREQSPC